MTPSENFELLRELLRGIDTDVVEPEELLRQDRKELGKAPHKAARHQVRDISLRPFLFPVQAAHGRRETSNYSRTQWSVQETVHHTTLSRHCTRTHSPGP